MKRKRYVLSLYMLLLSFPSLDNRISASKTYILSHIWPRYSNSWYFNRPSGLSEDREGYIYVADSMNDRIQKFRSDGQLVTQWGTYGGEAGQFKQPYDLVSDSRNFIYVTDSDNKRIQVFDSNGTFVREWSSFGGKGDSFRMPSGISVDASDYLYVSDTLNHRILKFDIKGKLIHIWGKKGSNAGELNWPYGVTADPQGFIYVCDSQNNRVQKFDTEGNFMAQWGTAGTQVGEFDWPNGIAQDGKGHIYVSDLNNNRIQKFDAAGNYIMQWGMAGNGEGNFNAPDGITVAAGGYVYVADAENHRIQKFSPKGIFISLWGSSDAEGELKSPGGICTDRDNFVYVADTENHRIQKFDMQGNFIRKWGQQGVQKGDFMLPNRLALHPSNDAVYIADTGNDRIQVFSKEGEFIRNWGQFGSGEGELNLPHGVAVSPDTYVYVADSGNHRIQKFDEEGNYVSGWGSFGDSEGNFNTPHDVATDAVGNVYVSDTQNHRIQKFTPEGEFILEWGGQGREEGQFQFPDGISADEKGFIFAIDKGNQRIQKFTGEGAFLSVWGEGGKHPGQLNYPGDLAVNWEGKVLVADSGNHRIQVFEPVVEPKTYRALIVAGGGPFPGNRMWDATRSCANFAYRTLNHRGFSKKNIFYLSADPTMDLDNNGQADDVYGKPDIPNLEKILGQEIGTPDQLVIYLVDHGGDGVFRLDGSSNLDISELSAMIGLPDTEVILIYDACRSGSLIEKFTPLSAGTVVITGSAEDEEAYFISQGAASFSDWFWTGIFQGNLVRVAFESASESVFSITGGMQNPRLDSNFPDPNKLNELDIGRGRHVTDGLPKISDMSHNIEENTAVISATVTSASGIAAVRAVVIPPNYRSGSSDIPVMEMPFFEMLPESGGLYRGKWKGFSSDGTYRIFIQATDRRGNTTISEALAIPIGSLPSRKALLIVSGSSDSSEPICKTTAFVRETLAFQGYAAENIHVLASPSCDVPTDAKPELDTIHSYLTSLNANNTQDLTIWLAGKGNEYFFSLNGTESLRPNYLAELLSTVPGTVTLICDWDYCGGFLSDLKGSDRNLISSSPADAPAPTDYLFSSFFFQAIRDGSDVRNAFRNASAALGYFNPLFSDSGPQTDDNGNGISNEITDGRLSSEYHIGLGVRLGTGVPAAGENPDNISVSPSVLRDGDISALIRTGNISTTEEISLVRAVILPPLYSAAPDELNLSPVGERKYEAVYENFDHFGTWHITVYVTDAGRNTFLHEKTKVFQSEGADIYEPDDSPETAAPLISGDEAQERSFHSAVDTDWAMFYAYPGLYTIRAFPHGNPSGVCDALLHLYESGGTSLIGQGNDGILVSPEITSEGLYTAKITPGTSCTAYHLEIYRPVAVFPGYIKGRISDAEGYPLSNVHITLNDVFSFFNLPDGRFRIPWEAGEGISLKAEKSGYEPAPTVSVTVSEGGTTVRNFTLVKGENPGDISDGQDECEPEGSSRKCLTTEAFTEICVETVGENTKILFLNYSYPVAVFPSEYGVMEMPEGYISLTLKSSESTPEISVNFSSPLPANAQWYRYDSFNDEWHDETGKVTFSVDRKSVNIQVTDGKREAPDGLKNGHILYSGGYRIIRTVTPVQGPPSGDVGGGGCFLQTLSLSTASKGGCLNQFFDRPVPVFGGWGRAFANTRHRLF